MPKPDKADTPENPGTRRGQGKVGVCHLNTDSGQYEYLEIPAQQVERGRGHGGHENDIVGITEDACLALNALAPTQLPS